MTIIGIEEHIITPSMRDAWQASGTVRGGGSGERLMAARFGGEDRTRCVW